MIIGDSHLQHVRLKLGGRGLPTFLMSTKKQDTLPRIKTQGVIIVFGRFFVAFFAGAKK
jgi:hypothetical protein